ncbi:hypothetical protein EG68_04025 [Paragonimus skrjabini miyazakii]|uniref:Arf-GAP domain-containing protein n=1 Tax=Paragonimus skrjabini miyazakii TaxID=59628 RepID=A0A8S9YUF8_9TREM|nr:hypothetical protein EG68_04025 [Paragonimus skrjabini miyazakii]
MQDKVLKILRVMVTHDENRYCFDCHQRGPTYVNITIGSFVCTNCGGALRKYNHRVKSISMSNFSSTEMDFLRKRGNKACRRIYLAQCEDLTINERELDDAARDEYLRQKYQLKKWYSEPTAEVEAEAIRENQQVIDRAEQTAAQQRTQRSITGNSSAGLILSVPQPPVPISSAASSSAVTKSPPLVQTAFNGASVPRSVQSQPVSEPLGGFSTDPFSPRSPDSNSTTRSDTTDPFANFAAATTALSTSGAKQSNDFFADFSSASISLSTHSVVPQATAVSSSLQPPVIPKSVWSESLSDRNFQVQKTTTSTTDKYAALAELDGLFKSTTSAPSGMDARGLFASNPPPSCQFNPVHAPNYYSPASSAFSVAFDAQHPSKTYNPFLTAAISMNATPKHHNALNPFTNPPPQSFTSSLSSVPVSEPSAPTVATNRNPFVLTTKQPQLSNHINPFFQQSHYSSSSGTRSFPASWMTQPLSAIGPVTSANDGFMSSAGTVGLHSTAQPVSTRAFSDFVPF